MIYSTLLTTTGPTIVYASTTTGDTAVGDPPVPPLSVNAITTIAFCNVGAPDLADETVNSANIDIQLVPYNIAAATKHYVVKSLTVPAGETVFFSDERIILNGGDKVVVTASAANLIAVTVSSMPV